MKMEKAIKRRSIVDVACANTEEPVINQVIEPSPLLVTKLQENIKEKKKELKLQRNMLLVTSKVKLNAQQEKLLESIDIIVNEQQQILNKLDNKLTIARNSNETVINQMESTLTSSDKLVQKEIMHNFS